MLKAFFSPTFSYTSNLTDAKIELNFKGGKFFSVFGRIVKLCSVLNSFRWMITEFRKVYARGKESKRIETFFLLSSIISFLLVSVRKFSSMGLNGPPQEHNCWKLSQSSIYSSCRNIRRIIVILLLMKKEKEEKLNEAVVVKIIFFMSSRYNSKVFSRYSA